MCADSVASVLRNFLRAGTEWGHIYDCRVTKVRLRVHLTMGSHGMPAAAQVAVESLTTKRPLLYVDWRPSRVRVYESDACQTSDTLF